ncbi:hypothetical protein PSTG_18009, partial [Puccinia striiformis f. sp. tritici PST-78]
MQDCAYPSGAMRAGIALIWRVGPKPSGTRDSNPQPRAPSQFDSYSDPATKATQPTESAQPAPKGPSPGRVAAPPIAVPGQVYTGKTSVQILHVE